MLSADRPLTESEVRFLQYVRQWGKKVVFVVNKVGGVGWGGVGWGGVGWGGVGWGGVGWGGAGRGGAGRGGVRWVGRESGWGGRVGGVGSHRRARCQAGGA